MGKIPKICNFYWGGGSVSYLQYLSVVSFKKYNPGWTINLFIPKSPSLLVPTWSTGEQIILYEGEDYLERLKKLCKVVLVDFEELGIRPNLHEVHKSDLIRWKILYDYGGVWSDLDILFIKPVVDIGGKTAMVYSRNEHIIGFYITEPHQEVFKNIYEAALSIAKGPVVKYQSLGSTLLNTLYGKGLPEGVINLPVNVVYPYRWDEADKIFSGLTDQVSDSTIGIHWYNGTAAAKHYQNDYDSRRGENNIINRYVREVCTV